MQDDIGLNVDIDFRDFEKATARLNARFDQLPFALANALNTAAFEAADYIAGPVWAKNFVVRRSRFPRAILRVEKATKKNLIVAIYDSSGGRAQLKRHATGGIKRPHGRNIAIPDAQEIKRGPGGVPRNMRPRIIAAAGKRGIRVIPGKGIFIGKGGRLHRLYQFVPQATIRKDFMAYEEFSAFMRAAVARHFPAAIRKAIVSAR